MEATAFDNFIISFLVASNIYHLYHFDECHDECSGKALITTKFEGIAIPFQYHALTVDENV